MLQSLASVRQYLLGQSAERVLVAKNFFWRTASTVLNKLVRLLVVVLSGRLLGPELIGQYNYLFSLASLAFIVSDWGVNILLVRDYQQSQEKDSVVATAFVTKVSVSLVSLAAGLIVFAVAGLKGSFTTGAVLLVLLVLTNVKELFVNVLLAVQRMDREWVLSVWESAVLLALFFLMFSTNASVEGLAIFYAASALVTAAVAWFLAGRLVPLNLSAFSFPRLRDLLRQGLPLSLFGIAGYIFFSTDQLFLKHFRGYTEVGWYSQASRIVLMFLVVPSLFTSVLLPYVSAKVGDLAAVRKVLREGLGLLLLAAVAVAGALFATAPFLVPTMYGEAFRPTAQVLQLMSLMLLPLFAVQLLDHLLIAYRKQTQDFYLTLAAAILNLLLNFALVPRYGMTGAVVASLTSQVVNVAATYWYLQRVLTRAETANA